MIEPAKKKPTKAKHTRIDPRIRAARDVAPTAIETSAPEADELEDESPEQHDAADTSDTGLESEPVSASPSSAPAPSSDAPKRTRYLKHVFRSNEIDKMRATRERNDETIETLGNELNGAKERVKSLTRRIEALHDEGLEISRAIRTGYDYRDVECIEEEGSDLRPDSSSYGKLGMVTRRLDTYEIVDWRELTKAERQGSLFDSSAAE